MSRNNIKEYSSTSNDATTNNDDVFTITVALSTSTKSTSRPSNTTRTGAARRSFSRIKSKQSKNAVVIDVEKEASSYCIDLTKDHDDNAAVSTNNETIHNSSLNDIAVIHEIKKTTKQQQNDHGINSDNNSTIIIDDERNDEDKTVSPIKKRKVTPDQPEIITSTVKNQNKTKSVDLCCPICLETIEELKSHKKPLMVTFCGHILCKICVDELFKSNTGRINTSVCPTCRAKITKGKIHSLYI